MTKSNRKDRIYRTTEKGEVYLPIGHYVLLTSENVVKNNSLDIIISGLGSCIALIMRDINNNIHAMSHILLPELKNIKKSTHREFPHKYAEFSVKELLNEMLELGAEHKNIKAAIIGGADIFRNGIYAIGGQNTKKVKEELDKFNIILECYETGGHRGRVIKYDVKNNLILSKFTGEDEFRILNKKGVKK